MSCNSCGATLVEGAAFCARCGASASAPSAPPTVVKRPAGVTLLAIYDIAAAAITLALAPFLEPAYITPLPRADGWGHAIVVRSDGREYALLSHGKNGAAEADREPGTTSSFESDIVFADGTFVRYPDGVQW